MDKNNDVMTIDLKKIFFACVRFWWLILLAAILGGGSAMLYTKNFVTPTYTSSTKIYVNNSSISVGNISINAADFSASTNLVKIYTEILHTKRTMDAVIERANLPYSYGQLMGMVSASSSGGTPIIKITATSTSADEAYRIAATVADVLPDIIGNIINTADAVIVDDAIYPGGPSGPNHSRNTTLGALLGCLLAVILIVVIELNDVSIEDESDIAEVTDLPIIGYISDFHKKPSRFNANRYNRYYYKSFDGEDGDANV